MKNLVVQTKNAPESNFAKQKYNVDRVNEKVYICGMRTLKNKISTESRDAIRIPRFRSAQEAVNFATQIVEEAKRPLPNYASVFREYFKLTRAK